MSKKSFNKKQNSDEFPINKFITNPNNPRTISKENLRKLVNSIKEFPEMLEKRPIVIDSWENPLIIGGNQRIEALKELKYKTIPKKWIATAEGWSEEQKNEFLIKDNVHAGEFDWKIIKADWNIDKLMNWGLDNLKSKGQSVTEKLSNLEYKSIYYEPENIPKLKLIDCVDLSKFEKKIEAINQLNLSEKQKEILKLFAYRFIKIDFESVANYYYFNATEEEKLAIERLRLVLTDNGIDGFIEDDLLKISNEVEIDD